MNRIEYIVRVDLYQYVYLNYFCKNVVRKGTGKIIPYKHCVIDLEEGSRIVIHDQSIEIGTEAFRHSKTETLVRLRKNAIWDAQESCSINYGCTVEVLQNAELKTEYFTMNSSSTIVCAKAITLGHDVMIARNVVIYDSDFHAITDEDGKILNKPKRVVIGDHVWIGTNATVLKGSEIGNNSIIGACEIVKGKLAENKILTGQIQKEYTGTWKR